MRKNIFKLLKLFEIFDENYEKLTNDRASIVKVNKKVATIMKISWILRFLYRYILAFMTNSTQILFLFYQMIFARLAEEQFIICCFHLLERKKLLNKTSENAR